MARMASQDLSLMGSALEVEVQALDFKAKAIKVVLINNPVKVISSNSMVTE